MEKRFSYRKIHRFMTYLLPLIGILIGGAKIIGTDIEERVFSGIGASASIRILFGCLQMIFGILIAFPRTQLAATIVSMGLLSAIAVLMAANRMFGIMLVPLIGFSVLVFFLWIRRKNVNGEVHTMPAAKD